MGGFLGSGKTSLMMAVGEKLVSEGLRVAVVTNDQGEFLVDTTYARSRGLNAGEILGGCFCCNFAELVALLESFAEKEKPDIILAEPVGSCTDLAATVLGPMKLYHEDLVELGPYIVLADGGRVRADSGLQGSIEVRKAVLTLNIRTLKEPGQIEEAARRILRETCSSHGPTLSDYHSEALIPGAPEPTYRI